MKAIILAAGRGSRLGNLTDERPKCLVELRGRPLLHWQLDALAQAGISEVAIVRGYRGELLEGFSTRFFDNPDWSQTNMVSSLACAEPWLFSEPCIVSYSDIFYTASAVRSLMNSTAELAITYDPNWRALWEKRFENVLSDAETFRLHEDGSVADIGRKPQHLDEVQGQYMGLLRFTPASWTRVQRLRSRIEPAVRDRLDMTTTLRRLILEEGQRVDALPYTEGWGEVDSQDDLAAYQ